MKRNFRSAQFIRLPVFALLALILPSTGSAIDIQRDDVNEFINELTKTENWMPLKASFFQHGMARFWGQPQYRKNQGTGPHRFYQIWGDAALQLAYVE